MFLYHLIRRLLDRYRFLRYASVSAVVVPLGQIMLYVFHSGLGWAPVTSNIAAVAIATVPAYQLNRMWVWGQTGKSHLTREIIPFWAIAFAGLLLSTWAVDFVQGRTDAQLAVNGANLVAFGALWVVKFFVCDQLLFGGADDETHSTAGDVVAAEVPTAP